MTLKTTSLSRPSVHFVGIGGIGISALARWFMAQNWAVTGSDLADSRIIASLRKFGARVKIGHSAANLPSKGLNMVIYTSAVPYSNPELIKARRKGLIPLSYPETVGCLTKIYRTIAVAGSHGKSTTTALASLVLIKAKLDPSVILGTNLKELGDSNFRKGRSKWLVLEADEWNASFLNYHPEISIVTNIDEEHLDFYKNLTSVKKTFLKFLGNTKIGGTLILNKEDKNLRALKSPIARIARRRLLNVYWYATSRLKVIGYRLQELKKVLRIPGEHNVSNAMAVLTLAKVLKIQKGTSLKALGAYVGSWRRFEFRGYLAPVLGIKYQISSTGKLPRRKMRDTKFKTPVFDDYAHHPTEIKATLQAFREKFPKYKIVCVYQPHQARRLKALFEGFISAFQMADFLILLPVYEVAGRDKVISTYSSKRLAEAIFKKYPRKKVFYLANPKRIRALVLEILNGSGFNLHDSCVVMMGAGDIVNYTPLLLKGSRGRMG